MALRADNVCKFYGNRAVVDGVSIAVEAGEVVGLLGPNGAGKTTTFHSIVGFVKPDEGRIQLDEVITGLPMYRRARQGIGYLPQETSIFRRLTVAQNIRAVLETRGLNQATIAERLDEVLAELDLLPRGLSRKELQL